MSIVVSFPSQGRSTEAIDADMAAEMVRHTEIMGRLLAERAGQPARAGGLTADPAAERRDCKAQAAHALGMTEQALTRFCLDYADEHPDRPPLAIQPGELRNGRWVVFTDRVRAARECGRPIRRRQVKSG